MKIDILFFSYSGASPVIGNAIYKLGFSNFFSDRHFPPRLSKMFAKLPRCGYLPLQTMNVEIHVNDQIGDANCEFNIKLIKVNRTEELSRLFIHFFVFMQQIHYFVKPPANRWCQRPTQREYKENRTIVNKTVHVRIQNLKEIVNVDLKVPAILPSDFSSNNMINVTYYVFVCKSF